MQKRLFAEYEPRPTAWEAPARLYLAPVIRLKIVRDGSVPAPRVIRSPDDGAAALRDRYAAADREVLVAVLLDSKNRIIGIDPVAVGSLTALSTTMREAFKSAMLTNAGAVVFAHNHPSGALDVSPEDRQFTMLLCHTGALLDILVLDHLILSSDGYVSLRNAHPDIWREQRGKRCERCGYAA